jgi:glycosyltransferase involved in cell wall biosynthesis
MTSSRYKQLLFINDYPPSNVAGAPIIARQLFRDYDPDRMDVLFCGSWARSSPDTFLPCRHTVVRSYNTKLRPRRIFGAIEASLNCLRLEKIMEIGRRIARERRVEALFTTSYGAEMPHAAYFLSKELGIPFYYFEMDKLDAYFLCGRAEKLITRNRNAFLKSAKKLWLISPAMVREYKKLYGVDGETLHHFLDIEEYQRATREAGELPKDKLRLVYTGSINVMLEGTVRWIAEKLNRGIEIAGRPVELSIYSTFCPSGIEGRRVHYRGFVKSEEIPKKLAESDILLTVSAFDAPPGFRAQVRTSVGTKTADYLASGRPVLLVGPEESALYDYCRDVSATVRRLDEADFVAALTRLATEPEYVRSLSDAGLRLVHERHSLEALDRLFLSEFRLPRSPTLDSPLPAR